MMNEDNGPDGREYEGPVAERMVRRGFSGENQSWSALRNEKRC